MKYAVRPLLLLLAVLLLAACAADSKDIQGTAPATQTSRRPGTPQPVPASTRGRLPGPTTAAYAPVSTAKAAPTAAAVPASPTATATVEPRPAPPTATPAAKPPRATNGPVATPRGTSTPRPAAPATPSPTPKPEPTVKLPPVRAARYLQPMPHEYQRMNNCGPVTVNMALGYYGTKLSQQYTAGKIRPHPDDVSVVAVEMVTFAQLEYGYGGLVGFGGNMELVEALVSAGVPVIVVQPMEPGSDINHFRVVRGYDRSRRTVTINDSYYGPNLVWTYADFQSLWEKRNNSYALVYPERRETLVRTIIEKYAGEARRRDPADLQRAQRDVERTPNDPWAWLQLGQRLYFRDQPERALDAWERARQLGLPEKALWYTVWPVSLLNDLGRHQQALSLANEALAGSPASSELYYERARAYDAMGSSAQARRNLQLALEYAPYHPRYREAMAYYRQNGEMQADG